MRKMVIVEGKSWDASWVEDAWVYLVQQWKMVL